MKKASKKDREIARYIRDGQWAFMQRIQEVGTLWFCAWNKGGRHKQMVRDAWVCCLMTGVDYLEWMDGHPDWFVRGEWSEARYAVPVQLTDAGRQALVARDMYEMEPLEQGIVEPGYTTIPLPPEQRERAFDLRFFTTIEVPNA